jgi:hypothetical protein
VYVDPEVLRHDTVAFEAVGAGQRRRDRLGRPAVDVPAILR